MPTIEADTAERIRDANVRYHDAAAASYDAKWGIDLGGSGQAQVRSKIEKALGERPSEPFEHGLEIGAGTGYFTLNMLQLGVLERATATDISDGMLRALEASARDLGLEAETVRGCASSEIATHSYDEIGGTGSATTAGVAGA